MKRITFSLPDQLAVLLDHERRRRDVPASAIVREALEAYLLDEPLPRTFSFIGIGRSEGDGNIAARVEEILEEEWGSEAGYNRLMYGHEDGPLPEQVRARERFNESVAKRSSAKRRSDAA